MNKRIFRKTVHSPHAKKVFKPLVICLGALFIISMLPVLVTEPVTAATTTPALHTSGSQVLDANGNVVYLRGMGIAGFVPNLILWGEGQGDAWGNQWNYNPTAVMDQTFQVMRDQWHINMIRVFVFPSWYYRDNITPAQEDNNYAHLTTPISTKAYLRTLCQEADKYGIYVDIVPYMLTPSTSSFGADPYASTGYGWQGMPMQGWDEPANRFLRDAGYANNEQGFWSWFWTDMANNLKDYPNAIFEAWNEPSVGSDADMIPSGYMTYLTTTYNAIRSTGATNLIMMQWHMGWFPNGYGNDLSWAKQIANAIPDATNLVYTTHFYYYAPSDLSNYWAKDYAALKSQIQTGIDSMGIVAPLVINEEGSCLTSSPNRQNDYTWWQNVLLAQRDLGLGAVPYYWLSDSGLGGVYSGETMLSSGYSPNTMGQHFINAYKPPTTTTKPTPTVTPTNGPTPTSTTAQPTVTPAPIPTTAPTPTSTWQPTTTFNPIPLPTSKPNATPNPTVDPAPTQSPTHTTAPKPAPENQTSPSSQSQIQTFRYHFWQPWFIFRWPPFNVWFFYF